MLYLSLEEPQNTIVRRMYAQEFGIDYSALHQGKADAVADLEAAMAEKTDRIIRLATNLKVQAFTGHPQSHEILDAINRVRLSGFEPELVILDQLEFIDVAYEVQAFSESGEASRPAATQIGCTALAPALLTPECLGPRTYSTWVLHQVTGATAEKYTLREISGGEEVACLFDRVIGIGRAEQESKQLRLFSLLGKQSFEMVVDADFPHMRFKPQRVEP